MCLHFSLCLFIKLKKGYICLCIYFTIYRALLFFLPSNDLDSGDDRFAGWSRFRVRTGLLRAFCPQEIITHYHNVSAQASGQPGRSSCSRYELSLVQNLSVSGLQPPLGNLSVLESYDLRQESCEDGWIYSTEYFRSTVVTEVEQ